MDSRLTATGYLSRWYPCSNRVPSLAYSFGLEPHFSITRFLSTITMKQHLFALLGVALAPGARSHSLFIKILTQSVKH